MTKMKTLTMAVLLTGLTGLSQVAVSADVVRLPALGAPQSTMHDTLDVFRTSIQTQGGMQARDLREPIGLWGSLVGAKFESDIMGAGRTYESDMHGFVLGVNAALTPDVTLGLAAIFGNTDTDVLGTSLKINNETSYGGAAGLLTAHYDTFTIVADAQYLYGDNDIKAIDSDKKDHGSKTDQFAFSLGTRVEMTAQMCQNWSAVPYAGVRYTLYKMNPFDFMDDRGTDGMNTFTIPVGVNFVGNYDYNGWSIQPNFGVGYSLMLGDREDNDFDLTLFDQNQYKANFGLNLANDDWMIGMNYFATLGDDGRQNESLEASVRYSF